MTDKTKRGGLGGLFRDLAAAAGALGVIHGVDLIYRPAAWIVAGGALLAGAWILARKAG